MTSVLAAILESTRRDLINRQAATPSGTLESRAKERTPAADRFVAALATAGRVNIIAECKRCSPSKGLLREDYEPARLAAAYERAGAAAISVLTEPQFFGGCLEHLAAVREKTTLPILHKDFNVCEYQLLEARAAGADAVLLIAAALSQPELTAQIRVARRLGLAPLVEVHDERELSRSLEAGATLVGLNSRNLHSFSVDLGITERLLRLMPTGALPVAESGIRDRADVVRLQAAGCRAFLVGEQLVTSADPGAALRSLLGEDGLPLAGAGGVGVGNAGPGFGPAVGEPLPR